MKAPTISSDAAKSSPDLRANPGYRAAEAFVRPSPIKTHGSVLKYGFDLVNCTFTLSLESDQPTSEDKPTEIFLPEYHFAATQTKIQASGGKWTISTDDVDTSGTVQILRWWHGEGEQNIKVEGVKRRQGMYMDREFEREDVGYLDQCKDVTKCAVM